MSDLHVWTNDEEFVIARDVDDADAVMREVGCTMTAEEKRQLYRLPDERPFTFCPDNDEATAVKKTCAEWCAEKGRGYFCAANY